MKLILNVLFALGLVFLMGLELYPQLGNAVRSSTSPALLNRQYTEETIQAFLNHGFGTASGPSGSVVRKWKIDIRVGIYGSPQDTDTRFLQSTLAQLGPLIAPTEISLVEDDGENANFHIHIVPRALFSQTLPQYNSQQQRKPTFSWCHWNGDSEMTKATLLIDSGLDAVTRHNELLRLLVRNLGLIGFTILDGESVFTDASRSDYSPLDCNIIQLLYETPIISGMIREQARHQLQLAGAFPSNPTSE